MGISIIGIIDKFSRLELGLFAVPNNRVQAVAIACWIRVVHCRGGMSVTMTTDKGGEWNTLISIATELRTQFQEFIPEDLVPTVTSVTSTVNITRERNWRPLWENELSNIAEQYKSGQLNAGYHPNDDFHQMVARWVWARIVQDRLDKLIEENGRHRIRKQKKSLLPTGGRRIDFYTKPHLWGGEDVLIPIPQDDLNRLLALYYDPELFQFGTNEFVALCSDLHHAIGSPPFVATAGWSIFTRMIQEYCDRQAPNGD